MQNQLSGRWCKEAAKWAGPSERPLPTPGTKPRYSTWFRSLGRARVVWVVCVCLSGRAYVRIDATTVPRWEAFKKKSLGEAIALARTECLVSRDGIELNGIGMLGTVLLHDADAHSKWNSTWLLAPEIPHIIWIPLLVGMESNMNDESRLSAPLVVENLRWNMNMNNPSPPSHWIQTSLLLSPHDDMLIN